MKKKSIYLIGFIIASVTLIARADLNIEITQGMAAAAPIAITSFDGPKFASMGQAGSDQTDIAEVIRSDLRLSGQFRPVGADTPIISNKPTDNDITKWQREGVENLVFGRVQPTGGGRYSVSFELWDVYNASQKGGAPQEGNTTGQFLLAAKRFDNVPGAYLRRLGHHISDIVFETLTGTKGAFSTRIAYVIVKPRQAQNQSDAYMLEIADMDGYNPKLLVKSREPLMSPTWSPDGKRIAFVSFEKKESEIYTIDVATGKRTLISRSPGINGAPAFSPDGRKMALVLSKDGSPKIYVMDLSSKSLSQITKGTSIDTEPAWTPDGRAIYFTSNRGGKPQIYKYDFGSGNVERVTFIGNYNARPVVSPEGDKLIMIHKEDGEVYRIARQDLNTGDLKSLTKTSLDESPSIAPNGAMVLYGTSSRGKRALGIVTIDGRGQLRLPAREGIAQEPAWSPFLS